MRRIKHRTWDRGTLIVPCRVPSCLKNIYMGQTYKRESNVSMGHMGQVLSEEIRTRQFVGATEAARCHGKAQGYLLKEIGFIVRRHHSTVSPHVLGKCKCNLPGSSQRGRIAFVPDVNGKFPTEGTS